MAKNEKVEVAFANPSELNNEDRSNLETILALDESLLNPEQKATLRAREMYLNSADRERFGNVLRETPLATDDAETKAKKSQKGIDSPTA